MEPLFTMRLCHIKKQKDQFGFNLASRNQSLCHIIGRVDPNTPAYMSGLRAGDRIIEINDTNVSNMTYEETVSLIKKGVRNNNNNSYSSSSSYDPSELNLLVIDKKTDEYLKRIKNQDDDYLKNSFLKSITKEKHVLKKKFKSAVKELDDISSEFSIKLNFNNLSQTTPDIEMITYI
jgi:C-terminal processing protease CtpA/Prc